MKKIFVRSPYFIEVNEAGQIGSKVELFIWNKGTTEPTTPTYTLSKKIPSEVQTNTAYNISNYAKEFIKIVNPVSVIVPTQESNNAWCYIKVKRYKETTSNTYTLLDTETFVCLNGYTDYNGGYNNYNDDNVVLLANEDIKLTHNKYVNVWLFGGVGTSDYVWSPNGADTDITVTESGLYKLPVSYSNINSLRQGSTVYFNIVSNQICEPKYTPITCTFVNRFGGWQYLTFFKANTQSIDVTSKDFNLLPSAINYNVLQGQKKQFNQQGKQKIKCNTGWVDENYSELIQDLLLSEVVLLDNKSVIVKSQSADIKTHLKDKNINYEIEFEYNYGLINDVI